MQEINYDEIYSNLIGFIDAITTKTDTVNKKDRENLIKKIERYIDIDTALILEEEDPIF